MLKTRNMVPLLIAAVSLPVAISILNESDLPCRTHIYPIGYTLSVDKHEPEHFHVAIKCPVPNSGDLILRMPRWSPGAYRIRDYAQNVSNFRVTDSNGAPLPSERTGVDGWRIKAQSDSIIVTYDVKRAFHPWSGVSFDTTYALVEGPQVFMYIDGHRLCRINLDIRRSNNWPMSTALQPTQVPGRFYAGCYDQLIDAPIQFGDFEKRSFQLSGRDVELVLHGEISFPVDSFATMVEQICQYQSDFFHEVPFERYVFFFRLLPGWRGGGGLEHNSSTTIGLSAKRMAKDYRLAGDVTAHEFFHVWNVKKFYPDGLNNLDYSRANRTELLWFSEGVTSYYEAITLVRTGIWTPQEFYDEMRSAIASLQSKSERSQISVAAVSWQIWERGYAHPGVSYYNKGQLLGLLLDLKIRALSGNRRSLDDVMLQLNREFGNRTGGFSPEDLEEVVAQVAGHTLSGFFDDYVRGTRELPFAEYLGFAGLGFDLQYSLEPSVGELVFVGPNNRIARIESGGTAYRAGLRRNDHLVSAAGKKVASLRDLREIISAHRPGDTINFMITRAGKRRLFPVDLDEQERVYCRIWPDDSAAENQKEIREGLLSGTTRR